MASMKQICLIFLNDATKAKNEQSLLCSILLNYRISHSLLYFHTGSSPKRAPTAAGMIHPSRKS